MTYIIKFAAPLTGQRLQVLSFIEPVNNRPVSRRGRTLRMSFEQAETIAANLTARGYVAIVATEGR